MAKKIGQRRRRLRDDKTFKFPIVSKEKEDKILNAKDIEELV